MLCRAALITAGRSDVEGIRGRKIPVASLLLKLIFRSQHGVPRVERKQWYFRLDGSIWVAKETGPVTSEVFIVDDDPLMRAALSIVLSDEGFTVTSFIDGESFLTAAQWRTPACVVIDMHLPGCSGLELLKALDARQYPAPIFVISGRGDIPMAVDAIRNGALDFIEKPFDPAMVAMRVRDAIQAWQNLGQEGRDVARDFN